VGESIRLGRIRGIELGAHWSVLVIGWLLVWALAVGTFPVAAPGAADVAYWLTAVATVTLFWMGLLAHELAHSLVANRRGVEVEGITLWLFGGVSRLRGEPASPGDELRIAIAGPATSLGIALGCAALASAVAAVAGPDLLVAGLAWLALINGVLALFNLAPGAPLDGGRVLHALVWSRSGDRSHATVVATNAGRWVGYALIGIGVLWVAAGDLGGIWFVFLGWFLLHAARAEATHLLVQDALAGVRVRDVMSGHPLTAPADISVAALLDEYVLRHPCSTFPLVDGAGNVTGLVTLRHLKRIPPAERVSRRVAEIATPLDSVARAGPDELVLELIERLGRTDSRDGRALVFEDGHLVGIVTPTDLNRALELARLRRG
jgi:Zn-dependent protease/CBS domain-containing protein